MNNLVISAIAAEEQAADALLASAREEAAEALRTAADKAVKMKLEAQNLAQARLSAAKKDAAVRSAEQAKKERLNIAQAAANLRSGAEPHKAAAVEAVLAHLI